MSNLFAAGNYTFELIRFSLTGDYDKNLLNIDESQLKVPHELVDLFTRNFIDFENHQIKSYMQVFFPEEDFVLGLSGFYLPETDSGDWIDQLIFDSEEERIAGEIEALDQENTLLNQEIESAISRNGEEIITLREDNSLSLMTFDDEIFMPGKEGHYFVIITSSKDSTCRDFYDKEYRLIKKEYWLITDPKNSKITKEEDYQYKESSFKPFQKSVKTQDSREIDLYNDSGLIKEKSVYSIYEEKEYLAEKSSWTYNSENQVLENIKITNTYDETFQNKTDTFEQKYLFSYKKGKDIPPDQEYYEDKVLKLKSNYSDIVGKYSSTIYFDDNFSVTTYYENNVKIKEVYKSDNKVWRIKNYEKK
ncbi:MAG: hypothetical protein K5866_10395 [Treponema sp.]|nr:hypothetical protein [Treponema sp.]